MPARHSGARVVVLAGPAEVRRCSPVLAEPPGIRPVVVAGDGGTRARAGRDHGRRVVLDRYAARIGELYGE